MGIYVGFIYSIIYIYILYIYIYCIYIYHILYGIYLGSILINGILMGFIWDLSKTNGDLKLVARGLKPIKYHILVG